MDKGTANFINLNNVLIDSYSDNVDETQLRPEIIIEEYEEDRLEKNNHFAPLNNFSIQPSLLHQLTILETSLILDNDVDFVIIRSNFLMRNIDITGKNLFVSLFSSWRECECKGVLGNRHLD